VARESPLDRSSSTRGVPARTDTRSSAKEEMPRATLWPSGMPRVDAPRLQNVSRTGGDSRGLQGTPGEGLGNKLRGGTNSILGSRAPSPVMKMAGTGSTPAASTTSPSERRPDYLAAHGEVPIRSPHRGSLGRCDGYKSHWSACIASGDVPATLGREAYFAVRASVQGQGTLSSPSLL